MTNAGDEGAQTTPGDEGARTTPELTAGAFRALEGTDFEVVDATEPITLRLASVTPLAARPGAARPQPFSLVFDGPATPLLPQATYRLAHATLGEIQIFLVPIGRGPTGGVSYEAIFN